MTLLIFYLVLAIGVSFICSLCEAGLLTLTLADAEVMIRQGRRGGARVRRLKTSIDRPLAAILTLNTIAHTVGAAGVGAQSLSVFGEAWIGATSAVLTLLVLVISEIIPKTIGATYALPLAGLTALTIDVMIILTWPVVFVLDAMSRLIKGGHSHDGPSREQIAVMAEMARRGGVLDEAESAIVQNMLGLKETPVGDVMTPRIVVRMADVNATAQQVADLYAPFRFSRLPVSGDGPDDIRGMVLKNDVLQAIVDGKPETPITKLIRPLDTIPAVTTLFIAMERFRDSGVHLFLVVDEFGGTAGVLTLEDLLESILGTEIVDETDAVADMRTLAKEGHDAGASCRAGEQESK